jgi:hypothetical protein
LLASRHNTLCTVPAQARQHLHGEPERNATSMQVSFTYWLAPGGRQEQTRYQVFGIRETDLPSTPQRQWQCFGQRKLGVCRFCQLSERRVLSIKVRYLCSYGMYEQQENAGAPTSRSISPNTCCEFQSEPPLDPKIARAGPCDPLIMRLPAQRVCCSPSLS